MSSASESQYALVCVMKEYEIEEARTTASYRRHTDITHHDVAVLAKTRVSMKS